MKPETPTRRDAASVCETLSSSRCGIVESGPGYSPVHNLYLRHPFANLCLRPPLPLAQKHFQRTASEQQEIKRITGRLVLVKTGEDEVYSINNRTTSGYPFLVRLFGWGKERPMCFRISPFLRPNISQNRNKNK